MKTTNSLVSAALFLAVASSSASASAPAALSSYFEQTIAIADGVMQDSGLCEALKGAQLQDFNPEFTAQASFGLSDVLHISVAPELDLVFVPTQNRSSVKETPNLPGQGNP